MRKRTGLTALAIAVLMALGITAQAEPAEGGIDVTSVTTDAVKITYTGYTGDIYAALYDGEGVLTGLSAADENNIVLPLYAVTAGDYTVKVFAWDKYMKPVAAPFGFNIKSAAVEDITAMNDNTVTVKGAGGIKLADDFKTAVNRDEFDADFAWLKNRVYNEYTRLGKNILFADVNGDGEYDRAALDYYGIAVVDELVADSADEVKRVMFKDMSDDITKVSMYLDDENVEAVFKLDGEEISPSELREYDVLMIKYDLNSGFGYSDYYDVTVTRKFVKGTCTGRNADGTVFYLDETPYEAALSDTIYMEPGLPYVVYLDANGRIAYYEEVEVPKNLGILTSLYIKNNGDYAAELIDRYGNSGEYVMNDEDALRIVSQYGGNAVSGSEYISGIGRETSKLVNQVVEYAVTSSNRLTIKEIYEPREAGYDGSAEDYRQSSMRLGAIKLSENTDILYLKDFERAIPLSTDNLIDGEAYVAYGYDRSAVDGTCKFVIITDGFTTWNSKHQIAVFLEAGIGTRDGDELDTVTLLSDGEEMTLYVDEDAPVHTDRYGEGDPILYMTDFDGDIIDILPLFGEVCAFDTYKSFDDFSQRVYEGDLLSSEIPDLSDGRADVEVMFGVLVDKGDGNYVLAEVKNGEDTDLYADLTGTQSIDVSGAKVYTYNYASTQRNHARLSTDTAIHVVDGSIYNRMISLNGIAPEYMNFALVRVFDDGEAKEIYQIITD